MSRSERPTACTTKRPRRSSAPASPRSPPDRGAVTGPRWLTLAVVSAATAMLLLDVTVVNVALPAIRADLDASFAELQWVVDAYALTLAATLLTAGALADRHGRRAGARAVGGRAAGGRSGLALGVFLINLPLGAVLTWSSLRSLPESRDPTPRALDLPGLVSFGAASF